MKYLKYPIALVFVLMSISWSIKTNRVSLLDTQPPFYPYMQDSWVDSLMQNMSLDEKIGQLFMVAAYSNKSKEHQEDILQLIKNQKIGGLIFFQGTPGKQIELTNFYQNASKIPLLIAGDWEWGLSMRLKNTTYFPRQMMLGAIQDDSLIYRMGAEIAQQIKRMGGHINFAPVVDINNNPKNPVIGSRSFGEDRQRVADLSYMYMKGMQDNGVLAVAKHFPGHGDTDTDSHKDLPVISHSRHRLDSVELFPFNYLIREGLGGVMVAHLFVPELDNTPNTATTLSRKVVRDLLKDEIGFNGIAFTDALNMKGVSKFFQPGEVDLKALLAGNDMLLFPKDVPKAIAMIKKAISEGLLSVEELDEHVRKILALKRWSGACDFKPIVAENIDKRLNNDSVKTLQFQLIDHAITLVQNNNNALPVKDLVGKEIASVAIGESAPNSFQKQLGLYTSVDHFFIKKFATNVEWKELERKLKAYDLVIFSFHKNNRNPIKNYGISKISIQRVEGYAKSHPAIVVMFANPYTLKYFKSLGDFKALIVAYNDWDVTQKITAQKIFGASSFLGRLPVGVQPDLPVGSGQTANHIQRLQYTTPLYAGVDETNLYKIDSIALNSIRQEAFPGCQVLAARNGKVFYHKSFGHHTYQKKNLVKDTDLYDLASLTKILATTPSLMLLKDQNLFDVDAQLVDYLPETEQTNKANLRVKDMLTHQARLKPWLPFYLETIKDEETKRLYYRSKPEGKWSVPIVDNMFLDQNYQDSIYQIIYDTDLLKRSRYCYSDLGFYLMHKVIEVQTHKPLNEYVDEEFYQPLGANRLLYLPLNRYRKTEIVPTEDETYYRHCLVHGYVHDMGAAMLGGVAGHAGLFANANDVAKMMQMYLWNGQYGGKLYISKETVQQFNSCQFCPENRRGLGFDKPVVEEEGGPTCQEASPLSYGHTGFTGTMVWVDPENGLLYIFLSNRIHPDSNNQKLLKLNTRTEIQKVLYRSVM